MSGKKTLKRPDCKKQHHGNQENPNQVTIPANGQKEQFFVFFYHLILFQNVQHKLCANLIPDLSKLSRQHP
jgi:hypothetical protein